MSKRDLFWFCLLVVICFLIAVAFNTWFGDELAGSLNGSAVYLPGRFR